MKTAVSKTLAFCLLQLMIFGIAPVIAEEPESETATADVMIYCALLNAHTVRQYGEEAAFISAKSARMFIGIASELTNEAYVMERIEKEAPALNEQAKEKNFHDWIHAELLRCSNMDFSPPVLARLQLLIEKRNAQTRR